MESPETEERGIRKGDVRRARKENCAAVVTVAVVVVANLACFKIFRNDLKITIVWEFNSVQFNSVFISIEFLIDLGMNIGGYVDLGFYGDF